MSDALLLVSGMAQGNGLAKTDDVCPICDMRALQRRDVEEAMACGVSDTVIKHMVKDYTGLNIDHRTIQNHIDHLPARYYTYKQIMDDQAKAVGVSIEDETSDKLTPVGYIQAVLNDAMQTLVANPKSTNQMVGITAAKTLMELKQNEDSAQDVTQWILRFKQLVNAVKVICSEDQIRKILELVDRQDDR